LKFYQYLLAKWDEGSSHFVQFSDEISTKLILPGSKIF